MMFRKKKVMQKTPYVFSLTEDNYEKIRQLSVELNTTKKEIILDAIEKLSSNKPARSFRGEKIKKTSAIFTKDEMALIKHWCKFHDVSTPDLINHALEEYAIY